LWRLKQSLLIHHLCGLAVFGFGAAAGGVGTMAVGRGRRIPVPYGCRIGMLTVAVGMFGFEVDGDKRKGKIYENYEKFSLAGFAFGGGIRWWM
jgi:hypothetical protein